MRAKKKRGWKQEQEMIKMDVEDAMRRPRHEVVLKEDDRVDSSGDEGSCREEAPAAAAAAAAKVN